MLTASSAPIADVSSARSVSQEENSCTAEKTSSS